MLKRLQKTLKEHLWIIAFVAVYTIAAIAFLNTFVGQKYLFSKKYSDVILFYLAVSMLIISIWHAIRTLVTKRPKRPLKLFYSFYKEKIFTVESLFGTALVVLLLTVFTSTFSTFKYLIPFVNPYSWDDTFIKTDRFIHFGNDPWIILQSFMGFPIVTYIINILYNLWFLVVYIFLFWQAIDLSDKVARTRFFLSYFLVWTVIGTVMAVIFSSVGPVYYGRLFEGKEVFQPLLDYLKKANESYPIVTLGVHDYLWDRYITKSPDVGSGISAMPSLHVATTFLFALASWNKGIFLRWFFIVYALCIFTGSIHLAWHYALDGYVGIAVTFVLWKLSGWAVDKYPVIFFLREKR